MRAVLTKLNYETLLKPRDQRDIAGLRDRPRRLDLAGDARRELSDLRKEMKVEVLQFEKTYGKAFSESDIGNRPPRTRRRSA